MTDRFKTALDVFNRLIPSLEISLEQKLRDFHNNEPIDDMLTCVREALTIAQEVEELKETSHMFNGKLYSRRMLETENEQLRKERDELASALNEYYIMYGDRSINSRVDDLLEKAGILND